MTPIRLTHEQTIDALVNRLSGKHKTVLANTLYHSEGKCVGEMDVCTLDWANQKLYVRYYEVKTGNYQHARKSARRQARNFLDHYKGEHNNATFIFFHPDKGFERWRT